MKKIAISMLIVAAALYASAVWADAWIEHQEPTDEPAEHGFCPVTNVSGEVSDCLMCHVRYRRPGERWLTKETDPLESFDPPHGASVLRRNGEYVGKFLLQRIDDSGVDAAFEYFAWHPEINRVIIEIHSPGGAVFDAWRIVNTIQMWYPRFEIETELRGMALSAGFLIFQAGETRTVAPRAEFMWHEVQAFLRPDIKTPSKLEDDAEVFRHLQDNAQHFIADRCNLTKEEIDDLVDKKEYWITGAEAVKLGLADRLMW